MRLCFASLSHEEIHQGVAALAEICRSQFGLPPGAS
jgi:2-aminoadipate transaminase